MRKKLLPLIVFCGLFYAINLAVGHFLEQPKDRLIKKGKFFPYLMWKDFHSQPYHSLDLFFLGSSHTYRSYDPEIFDAAWGSHSFNLGTSAQSPSTGYFVLKEALNTQRPKALIMEIYWLIYLKQDQFYNISYNYEFMRSPSVRNEFYKDGFDWQSRLILLFPSYRYRNNLENCLRLAMGKDLKWVDPSNYKDKGYVESLQTVTLKELNKKDMFSGLLFKKEDMEQKQILYIKKIVELCRSKNISIVFVTAPLPPLSISKVRNYKDVYDYFHQMAAGLDVPYIDSNIEAPKNLFNNEDFTDGSHLNKAGVIKFDSYIISRLKFMDGNPPRLQHAP